MLFFFIFIWISVFVNVVVLLKNFLYVSMDFLLLLFMKMYVVVLGVLFVFFLSKFGKIVYGIFKIMLGSCKLFFVWIDYVI